MHLSKYTSLSQGFLYISFGLLIVGCGSVQRVVIPPQQKLVVSENEQESFKIKVANQGRATVRIWERLSHGEEIDLGFLSGENKRKSSFLSGSAAVISNVSVDTAYLKLQVFGSAELTTQVEAAQ
ncbi:hypothetical protein [Tunicatimonas pelagia]|uniref:hypothetical protein n=1 Tax=Tunicatimonas pelagia TaxID=931531 RepID=UPI002665EFB2|nr:hypothetical protein [Tunicatimonas pelagia]WKN44646.1 hypothetical protein P0M28_06670 [Tunicatimonas pelagia]